MKHKFSKLLGSAKKLNKISKRNKLIIAAVIAIALVAPATAFAISRPAKKPVTKHTPSKHSSKKVAAAVTPASQPQTQAQSQPSKPVANTQSIPSAQNKPTASPSTAPRKPFTLPPGVPPYKPAPPSTPSPLVFSIAINTTGYNQVSPYQFNVPFTMVIHQGRYTSLNFSSTIISRPSLGDGVQCFATFNGGGGVVAIYLPQMQSAVDGQYVCQIRITADGSTVTNQFSFTVTGGAVSIP